ncbi:hypothetical protein EYD25_02295 [Klebsiella pneumoniae]|nr:hypothetical protein EYD25_02295 [Klebsiella pneumoniae]HBY4759604.1 hypothetical protein [Klebsiella pneumoniae]
MAFPFIYSRAHTVQISRGADNLLLFNLRLTGSAFLLILILMSDNKSEQKSVADFVSQNMSYGGW